MGFWSNLKKGIGNFFKGVGEFLGNLWNGFVGFLSNAYNSLIGSFGSPYDSSDYGATQDVGGVLVQKYGSDNNIPVVYGYRRVGSTVIHAETNGDNNKYLYVIYAICEGEIRGINELQIDGTVLPLSQNSDRIYTDQQQFNITQGKYADRVRLQLFYGTESQQQSALANGANSWSKRSTRDLPGLAYCVARFEWKKESDENLQNQTFTNPFGGSIPQMKFNVLGKKVYNVINHAGGSDLSTTYENLTKTYSYNPANCLLDYLLSPRYGCGFAITDVDADTFKTAAKKFNQKVSYDLGGTQSGKILTCNAVINTRARLFDNVKMMLAGSRSFMPFTQGRFKLKVEDAGHATNIQSNVITSTIDIDETNMIGRLALEGENKQSKYNKVIVKYVDPDLEFTEQEVTYAGEYISGSTTIPLTYPATQPGYATSLGADRIADGEDLIGEFKFPTISNRNIALDFAEMIYKKSRAQQKISFECTPNFIEVEPGDIIRVTNTVMQFSLKTFRVLQVTMNDAGNVQVDAVEHTADFYPYTPKGEIVIPAPVFEPTEYILEPPIKVRRDPPIQVQPPQDPEPPLEPDSTEIPVPIDPPPEPIEPDPPIQTTLVKKFRNIAVSSLLGGTDQTLTSVRMDSGLSDRLDSFINRIGQPAGIQTLQFSYNAPADTFIDQLILREYNINQGLIINTYTFRITESDSRFQQATIPYSDESYFQVRFKNSDSGNEFGDASNQHTAVNFTDLNLNATSGTNLEAHLNSFIQANPVPGGIDRITKHQLN